MTETPLPKPGTRIVCINNQDRPKLVVGQEYIVVFDIDVQKGSKMPINEKMFYPDDYRWIAIRMPDKSTDIYPNGLFEVVK